MGGRSDERDGNEGFVGSLCCVRVMVIETAMGEDERGE